MQLTEVMDQLEAMGSERTRRIYRNHGAAEPIFGVAVGSLKTLVKTIKKDQPLAEQLYATGNGDAMYLAGLIGDPKTVSPAVLDAWAAGAEWYMVSEYAVGALAAESPHGWDRGLAWIESDVPHIASTGWATLGGVVSVRSDDQLDLDALDAQLDRVAAELHDAPNRVRYTMNGFVIGVGCYVASLSVKARAIGEALGTVRVDLGNTACKVPEAPAYIDKVVQAGRLGRKRKKVRC
ncbi:MAG: DNA alkylation repair protein [Acidobacteriota bacterium]